MTHKHNRSERTPNDPHYAGILLKGQEVAKLQYQFREPIQMASRLKDGAMLVAFKDGDISYKPSRSYQRARSKYQTDKKHKPVRVVVNSRYTVTPGQEVILVKQEFISLRLSKRLDKFFNLLMRLAHITISDN